MRLINEDKGERGMIAMEAGCPGKGETEKKEKREKRKGGKEGGGG
jgi:hypothetical protein